MQLVHFQTEFERLENADSLMTPNSVEGSVEPQVCIASSKPKRTPMERICAAQDPGSSDGKGHKNLRRNSAVRLNWRREVGANCYVYIYIYIAIFIYELLLLYKKKPLLQTAPNCFNSVARRSSQNWFRRNPSTMLSQLAGTTARITSWTRFCHKVLGLLCW